MPQESVTVTLIVTREVTASPEWVPMTAIADDGATRTILQGHLLEIRPYRQYFPLITQNK